MSNGTQAIYSVSALVNAAKSLLENEFPGVTVEGEISNLVQPRSGHIYFTLKDAAAQIRCVMFRREVLRARFMPGDGRKVLARGRLSIYPTRGDFQFYVTDLEEAGLGALQHAFEQLKQKLAAEGLFAAEIKRPLPRYPQRIGVITSATGAAIRDILKVLAARWPPTDVLIYPTPVQGDGAAESIVAALGVASQRRDCDLLILARGGGSLEDLWPFNEEKVARAIRTSSLPVISGVGHETDFTIADLAADWRAPTPSAAAAAVVPDKSKLLSDLVHLQARLRQTWRRDHNEHRRQLAALTQRLGLQHPRKHLETRAQRLDELATRLAAAPRRLVSAHQARLATVRAELARGSPGERLRRSTERIQTLRRNLVQTLGIRLEQRRAVLAALAASLASLGPEQTLARGYAIVFDTRDRVLRDAAKVHPGDPVRARLARGSLRAVVESTSPGKDEG